MARLSKTAPTVAVDLVDDFLGSQAVARMLGYAEMAGPNAVSLACHDLRQGRAVVVDSALLPSEVSGEFFDPVRLTHVRVRLQRGERPEVVDNRAPVVPEEPEEPSADTVPLEVTP